MTALKVETKIDLFSLLDGCQNADKPVGPYIQKMAHTASQLPKPTLKAGEAIPELKCD